MSDRQVTIRMPKESLDKWLAALRSGSYQQGVGALYDNSGGYCCLGVLQKAVSGKVENLSYPSVEWLNANKIKFYDSSGGGQAPFLPALRDRADIANDHGRTFTEIADAIEQCAEGF